MSDETNKNEGWTTVGSTGASAGYCQDCGRPLTPDTARPVGNSCMRGWALRGRPRLTLLGLFLRRRSRVCRGLSRRMSRIRFWRGCWG